MITRTCNFCGDKYKVFPCKKDKRKYCSEKCYHESRKGKPLSVETRKKLSAAKKGKKHPMWGKHLSEETRRKIGQANRGRTYSEETKKKMSISMKKWAATPEGQKQRKTWPTTLEGQKHIEKLGKLSSERNIKLWKQGKHPFQNPEVRERAIKAAIEASHKKLKDGTHSFQNPENRIKAITVASRHRYGGTWIERKIGYLLKQMSLEYEIQKPIPSGRDVWGRQRYLFPDFFLPDHTLIIECDGEYWHQDKAREKRRDSVFFEQGYGVLHLMGKEIHNDIEGCRAKIESLIV